MSQQSAILRCKIITPTAQIIDTQSFDVVLPAHDGLLGVLPGHAPLLCNLGIGLLRYRDSDKNRNAVYIEGGFGHIRDNEVTILTRRAFSAEEVTTAEAEEQLLQARTLPTSTIQEVQTRSRAIQRAKHLLTLAESI